MAPPPGATPVRHPFPPWFSVCFLGGHVVAAVWVCVRARGCAWWVLPALADGGVHVAFADRTMLTLPRWAPLLCDRRPRTLVHLRPRRPELCPRARALVT
jgi:hypothetical protein